MQTTGNEVRTKAATLPVHNDRPAKAKQPFDENYDYDDGNENDDDEDNDNEDSDSDSNLNRLSDIIQLNSSALPTMQITLNWVSK